MEDGDSMYSISHRSVLMLRIKQLNVKPDEHPLKVKLQDTLPKKYESLRRVRQAGSEE